MYATNKDSVETRMASSKYYIISVDCLGTYMVMALVNEVLST